MNNITLADWAILHFLYTDGYDSRLRAVKLADIDVDKKPDSLYKRLKTLCNAGFVSKGMSDSRLHTYYITPRGIEFYKEEDFSE